uniref:Uncharacterized protein n=1 Tax=Romanomermis culicivorax TaxID=13658 RepID=A0A915L6J5_ROMCU
MGRMHDADVPIDGHAAQLYNTAVPEYVVQKYGENVPKIGHGDKTVMPQSGRYQVNKADQTVTTMRSSLALGFSSLDGVKLEDELDTCWVVAISTIVILKIFSGLLYVVQKLLDKWFSGELRTNRSREKEKNQFREKSASEGRNGHDRRVRKYSLLEGMIRIILLTQPRNI